MGDYFQDDKSLIVANTQNKKMILLKVVALALSMLFWSQQACLPIEVDFFNLLI